MRLATCEKNSDGNFLLTFQNPNSEGTIFFSRTGQDPAVLDIPKEIERFEGEAVPVSRNIKIKARIMLANEWSPLDTLDTNLIN